MKIAARVFLFVTGILLLSHYLPAAYWLLVDRQQRIPIVFYSCIEKRFLFSQYRDGELKRTDAEGNRYDRDEFERLLPLDNYMQLYKDGRMPKTIAGIAVTPEKLRRDRLNLRVKPVQFDSPAVALYPLLECESGRVRLEMPPDVMRLGPTVEFIDVKSNSVLLEKTSKFRAAFAAAGFVFPSGLVGGNPSTLKPYDEGYFLTDAAGAVFHLRQVRGEAELKRVASVARTEEQARWAALKLAAIHVQEQDNREIRALLIEQDGRTHLVEGPDYHLVTLPLERFKPGEMTLTLRGDMLNRLVTVTSDEYLEAIALDRDYQLLQRHQQTLIPRSQRAEGRLASILFPFTLGFEEDASGYLSYYFTWGSLRTLWIGAGLAAAFAAWLLWRREFRTSRAAELALVLITGVFGLLVVLVAPRSS